VQKVAPQLLHTVSLVGTIDQPPGPRVQVLPRFPKSQAPRAERYSPAIIYPGRALVHGVEGEVLVEFGIAADGTTVQPQVVRSTHPEYLDRAALRAARQTVYDTDHKTSFSGVKTAQDLTRAGGLWAVTGHQPSKAQKLFLFRLNDAR
jgi:TonB family protein